MAEIFAGFDQNQWAFIQNLHRLAFTWNERA